MQETQETWVQLLAREDPLEKEIATHSYFLAWRILWGEKPGGLQSIGHRESVTTEHALFTGIQKGQSNTSQSNHRGGKSEHWSLVLTPCLTLFDPMNCSLPGSSVHGILLARILEWVVIPFSRGSSQPRDWIWASCRFFTLWETRKVQNNHYLFTKPMKNSDKILWPVQK